MKTDYKTIRVEMREGVALLVMDNPPVNQLSSICPGTGRRHREAFRTAGQGRRFDRGRQEFHRRRGHHADQDIRTRAQILGLLKDNNRFLIPSRPAPNR